MFRSVVLMAVVGLLFSGIPVSTVPGAEEEEANQVEEIGFDYEVDSALLMEVDTGKAIWENEPHKKAYPASITKIMTALVIIEALEEGKISLEDEVNVSPRASSMGGTQLFLSSGDQVKLEKLLVGLMSGSANDAAVALAEHTAGSLEKFVEEMNKKAEELEMENTRFQNPHGLHHPQHYTTAYDIGLMSRALLHYPQVLDWTTVWMDESFLQGEIRAGEVFLSNTNRMIHYYQGCDGLKTGFTDQAGQSIAATAQRGDTRFLAIALGAPSSDERYHAARHLLDYGFARYQAVPLHDRGEIVAVVPVEKGTYREVNAVTASRVTLLQQRGEEVQYQKEINLETPLFPPIEKGEKIGKIRVFAGEEEEVVALHAAWEVEPADFKMLLGRLLLEWFSSGR